MIYDELLAKINKLPETIGLAEFKVRHDALRAVVELHRPLPEAEDSPFKDSCFGCGKTYPCKTIKSIEKVLNG